MARLNIHIYPSFFKNESRMLRECNSVLSLGLVDKIIIVALRDVNQNRYEQINENLKVHRISLFSAKLPVNGLKEFIKYYEFMIRIVFFYLLRKVSVLNIHSLHVLPLALIFKFKRTFIIYDTHELETEVNGARGVKKKIAKIVEMLFILFTNKIITVSPSIQKWYKKRYNYEEVYLIRNIPNHNSNTLNHKRALRDKFNLEDTDILFIYQGILAKWRGTEMLIETFKLRNDNKHLVFMGMGPMEERCKEISNSCSNIHFLPAVPPNNIIEYTNDANVGLSIIMNTCLSYYYCLPNKIFEYIASGIPVIVSNFPDLESVILQPKLGWSISPNLAEIARLIDDIDQSEIDKIKSNVNKEKHIYNWEKESNTYKLVYDIFNQN